MYSTLLFFHSIFRWLVLASLLYAVFRAYTGYTSNGSFTKTDDSIRHWTATISHIQLTIGFTLYFISPIVKYFLAQKREAIQHLDIAFFGIIHISLMLIAVVMITIGSASAKRKPTDKEKFKAMHMLWFSAALLTHFSWPFRGPFLRWPIVLISEPFKTISTETTCRPLPASCTTRH
jgi:hypothetical protein